MAARQSDRLRQLWRARQDIERKYQAAILPELRWLWRRLYPQLRSLKGGRDAHLAKGFTVAGGGDLWDVFQERLKDKLALALFEGTVTLADIDAAWFKELGRAVPNIDPEAIARGIDLGSRITAISDETRREIGRAVQAWYNTPGAPISQLTDSVQYYVQGKRADAIARTEVTALNSEVTADTMRQLRVEKWWWSTRRDQIVCVSSIAGPDGHGYAGCRALHGKVFKLGDSLPPYCSHPQCVLPGQVVSIAGLGGASKSLYSGQVIEITLVNGRNLSITPNHPILTARGWVSADKITERDQIAYHRKPEHMAFGVKPNDHYTHTAIEQVFSALEMSCGVRAVSVPPTPHDFHGDGGRVNGNIDIVRPDRELLLDRQTGGGEPLSQLSFGGRDVQLPGVAGFGVLDFFGHSPLPALTGSPGGPREIVKFPWGGVFEAEQVGLPPVAAGDTVALQQARDYGAAYALFGCDGKLRLSRNIVVNDGLLRQAQSGGTSDGIALLFETAMKFGLTDAKLVSNFINRETPFVHFVGVSHIERDDFAGHVYDLQSDMYALYTVNGVIVKNCRCTPVPKLSD